MPPKPQDFDSLISSPTPLPLEAVAQSYLSYRDYVSSRSDAELNKINEKPIYNQARKTYQYPHGPPTSLLREMTPPLRPNNSSRHTNSQGERFVTSGPGDARSVSQEDISNRTRVHMGLDFRADIGEPIYATADGKVSAINVQRNRDRSPISNMTGAYANNRGDILSSDGRVIRKEDVGFGGLYVRISHTGDFRRYRTEYMHLSRVNPELVVGDDERDSVIEGVTIIGYVGISGGNFGTINPVNSHLHWQILFASGGGRGYVVNPEQFVAFAYTDSNKVRKTLGEPALFATRLFFQKPRSAAEGIIAQASILGLQGLSRSIDQANMSHPDIHLWQSKYSAAQAAKAAAIAAGTLQGDAATKEDEPPVRNAQAFNFDTGLWTDGLPI